MESKTNKTFELFEQLLLSKKYNQLSLEEKNAITEFCSSETEFHQMQFAMNSFKNNIATTLGEIQPSYHVFENIQQALSNKWNKTSFHLNSILDSFISWLRIENYALRTSVLIIGIVSIFWFSFKAELNVNTNKNSSANNIIADSSYKNLSCDSSFVKNKALAP